MTRTIVRTVPCARCGHRIAPGPVTCPYCGNKPRSKPQVNAASHLIARAVGRCTRCGGRVRRDRGIVALVRKAIRWPRHTPARPRFVCSSCGHRERPR